MIGLCVNVNFNVKLSIITLYSASLPKPLMRWIR